MWIHNDAVKKKFCFVSVDSVKQADSGSCHLTHFLSGFYKVTIP